jgi:hypothetical protein
LEQFIKIINTDNTYDQAAQCIGSRGKGSYPLYKDKVYDQNSCKKAGDDDDDLFYSIAVYYRSNHEHIEKEFDGRKKVIERDWRSARSAVIIGDQLHNQRAQQE